MKNQTIALLITLSCFAAPAGLAQDGKRISYEELVETSAAKLFQLADYNQALQEFQNLEKTYEQDPLIKRYIGMTLTLLGRLDEAAKSLEESVQMDPDNPANHYFLARVYHEQGNRAGAETELKKVIELDKGGYYGGPAKQALPLVEEKKLVYKPWDLWGKLGYEYDSNVTLESNEERIRSLEDQNAGRYYVSTGESYNWLERGRFRSQVKHEFYQSLHDDNLNEYNYTFNEFGINNRYKTKLMGKDTDYFLRFEIPFGFLDGNIFSFGVQAIAAMRMRLTKNTRSEIYHRYSHMEFGPDGSMPPLTSRDGEYNTTGVLHRYYFSRFKRNVYASYDISNAAAEGRNYDYVGHRVSTGFYTPLLIENLSLDLSASFETTNHYHYSTELFTRQVNARRDNDWSFYCRLTYELTKNWSIQAYYRYVNANNKNDIFQHDRHIGGTNLQFRF